MATNEMSQLPGEGRRGSLNGPADFRRQSGKGPEEKRHSYSGKRGSQDAEHRGSGQKRKSAQDKKSLGQDLNRKGHTDTNIAQKNSMKEEGKGATRYEGTGAALNERTYQEVEYLKRNLGPILVAALAEICIRRPTDPIEYLGHWLLRWRYNEELKRREMQNALEVVRKNTTEETAAEQQSSAPNPYDTTSGAPAEEVPAQENKYVAPPVEIESEVLQQQETEALNNEPSVQQQMDELEKQMVAMHEEMEQSEEMEGNQEMENSEFALQIPLGTEPVESVEEMVEMPSSEVQLDETQAENGEMGGEEEEIEQESAV